jgi:transcriptional regulator GlxA family with amidase domain
VPPAGGYLLWKLPATVFRQLQQNHARCREEVARPDGLTTLALERLRLDLELCLARMKQSKSRLPEAANRLDLAIRWMQQNLSVRRPVAFLGDYLQMSATALERLFLENVGELPSAYFQRLKMQHAAQLLREDALSVKEIAFSLGYTHASDFTRAFKTFTGRTPEAERRAPSRRTTGKARK